MDPSTVGRFRGPGLIVAIAAPLVVLGAAYVLWAISDRLLSIGPFDRAAFGWTFVIPLWLAAPIVAGVVWWRMPVRVAGTAAATIVVILAIVSAWLLWKAVALPGCQFGARATAEALIVPASLFGITLGSGVAVGGLLVRAALVRGARGRAIAVGLVATVIAFLATMIVALAVVGAQGCQRPPNI
jgi:hypothetical protein